MHLQFGDEINVGVRVLLCVGGRGGGSDNVELADGGPLLFAALVGPLPVGGPGQDDAVLGLAPVGLRGPAVGRVPVFVREVGSGLVYPDPLLRHVGGAEPDLLPGAHALADVVPELVVLVGGRGRPEDAAEVVAVLGGGVVAFSHGVNQIALPVDLYAFQTDWKKRLANGYALQSAE